MVGPDSLNSEESQRSQGSIIVRLYTGLFLAPCYFRPSTLANSFALFLYSARHSCVQREILYETLEFSQSQIADKVCEMEENIMDVDISLYIVHRKHHQVGHVSKLMCDWSWVFYSEFSSLQNFTSRNNFIYIYVYIVIQSLYIL